MHLNRNIVAPVVVEHTQIPVDICVANPATASAGRQTEHDMIELTLHSTKSRVTCGHNSVSDNTISRSRDSVTNSNFVHSIGYVNSSSRGLASGIDFKRSIGACKVLGLE